MRKLNISKIPGSSLSDLPRLRNCRRRRISSATGKSGGNRDGMPIEKGETKIIFNVEGSGRIVHIYMSNPNCDDEHALRKILLRMYWDGEKNPSVEVPMGDFFGMGFGTCRNFVSAPMSMGPRDGKSFQYWFPMPFSDGAKIEVVNDCDSEILGFYYYFDYEEYDQLEEGLGRFHAQWRRENPTKGWGDNSRHFEKDHDYKIEVWNTPNLKGENNYVILDAEGKGQYVGCNLNIYCKGDQKNNWYGEGDDMIFIDGSEYPILQGTGTEDYFNGAWDVGKVYCYPYNGLTLQDSDNFLGRNSMYRFHIEDPICFEKSIRVTIEHGHANNLSNDYSSTAYWYQLEPHKPFPKILLPEKRIHITERFRETRPWDALRDKNLKY